MMWPTFPKWWLNRGTQSDGNCVGGRKNSSILQSQLAWVSESDCNPPLGRVRLLSLPLSSSSAPNHHHHLLRTASWVEPPLFIDCQVSHSGPLLQYRYNSRPWNIIVYHAIPRNLKSKCCYCQIWSNSIKGTQTKRQRAIVGWWTKIELSDDWGKYHKYQISLKER